MSGAHDGVRILLTLVHPCHREPIQVSPVRQQTFKFCPLCLCEKFHGEQIFFMWSFWVDIKLQWLGQLSGTAGTHYFADTEKLWVTPYRVSAQPWNSTKKYFGQTMRKVLERGSCPGGKTYNNKELNSRILVGGENVWSRGWRKKYVQAKKKRHQKISVEGWLTATSLQRPLSSVPKEAVVERLNCTCKVKTPPPTPLHFSNAPCLYDCFPT